MIDIVSKTNNVQFCVWSMNYGVKCGKNVPKCAKMCQNMEKCAELWERFWTQNLLNIFFQNIWIIFPLVTTLGSCLDFNASSTPPLPLFWPPPLYIYRFYPLEGGKAHHTYFSSDHKNLHKINQALRLPFFLLTTHFFRPEIFVLFQCSLKIILFEFSSKPWGY